MTSSQWKRIKNSSNDFVSSRREFLGVTSMLVETSLDGKEPIRIVGRLGGAGFPDRIHTLFPPGSNDHSQQREKTHSQQQKNPYRIPLCCFHDHLPSQQLKNNNNNVIFFISCIAKMGLDTLVGSQSSFSALGGCFVTVFVVEFGKSSIQVRRCR